MWGCLASHTNVWKGLHHCSRLQKAMTPASTTDGGTRAMEAMALQRKEAREPQQLIRSTA